MTESSHRPLFVVTLRYDTPDVVLKVPKEGLKFLHPSGVKVLLGYRPDKSPAVLTETDHDDEDLLRLIEADKPGTEPADDDPRLTAFMEKVRTSHRHAANDIVSNLRWMLARPGGHLAVGRRQSARYCVRDDNEWRPLLMRRRAPLTDLSGTFELDDAWRGAIQEATRRGWKEPLAHMIQREGKAQIDANPRSAIVLIMTALEVGLKQQASRLPRPKHNAQGKVSRELPWAGPRDAVQGDVGDVMRRAHRLDPTRWIKLPQWAASRLDDGRIARNAVVHEGGHPPDRSELMALARLVRDLLYLLDYQAGHDWAEQYVGYKQGDGDIVFGDLVVQIEMSED